MSLGYIGATMLIMSITIITCSSMDKHNDNIIASIPEWNYIVAVFVYFHLFMFNFPISIIMEYIININLYQHGYVLNGIIVNKKQSSFMIEYIIHKNVKYYVCKTRIKVNKNIYIQYRVNSSIQLLYYHNTLNIQFIVEDYLRNGFHWLSFWFSVLMAAIISFLAPIMILQNFSSQIEIIRVIIIGLIYYLFTMVCYAGYSYMQHILRNTKQFKPKYCMRYANEQDMNKHQVFDTDVMANKQHNKYMEIPNTSSMDVFGRKSKSQMRIRSEWYV